MKIKQSVLNQRDNKCNKCNNWFIAVLDKKGLLPVTCKSCILYENGIKSIKRKYDISYEEAKRLVDLRNQRRCQCCNDKWRPYPFSSYHIDHDHDTDEVRGVVCPSCNIMFGQLECGRAGAQGAQDYHYKWLEYKLSRWPRYIKNTD